MNDKIGSTEPAADMREAAAALWSMYVALIKEGFSEKQALTIIGHAIAASFGGE